MPDEEGQRGSGAGRKQTLLPGSSPRGASKRCRALGLVSVQIVP